MKLNRSRTGSEARRGQRDTRYAIRNTSRSSLSGFTLVELMAVIVIIGIVSGIVIGGASIASRKGMEARTIATIQQICTAVDMFYNDRGGYPADMWCTTSTSDYNNDDLRSNQDVWPCEALWYYLAYKGTHLRKGYQKSPYIMFKREQLTTGNTKIQATWDDAPGNFMRVVDAWGNPLNYKSNNGSSYRFATQFNPSDVNENLTLPRHNRNSYDLCSYGADGTTWQERDKPFDRQRDLKLDQMRNVTDYYGNNGEVPNYFFKPFDAIMSVGSGVKHCFAGEDNDDLNNWQKR